MTGRQRSDISSRIDQIFTPWQGTDTPGAQVAVVRNGELVHSQGYGSAQLEYGVEITPETVFHVASVSKQFSAAAVILLALGGKLSLDDDIREHLPQVPDFGHKITIMNLIHHTSGLRDQWELLVSAGWRMDDVITRDHIMKMVVNQRQLNFVPGAEHLYCNTGYSLLAEIVDRVAGISLREFSERHIFTPLGMSRTHIHDDHAELVPGRAYSYTPDRRRAFKNSVLNYANSGATSLFTTAGDLVRWLCNLDRPTIPAKGEEFLRLMHTRGILNDGTEIPYASGLSFSEHRGLRVVGHSGGDAGFRSWCGRLPDHDLGIVVLSNLATFRPQVVAMKIAEICVLDHVDSLPGDPRHGPLPGESEIEECTGTYLRLPHGMAEVIRDDGELQVVLGDEEPAALVPLGGLAFRIDPGDTVLSFFGGEDGTVDRLELDMGGATITATRFCPLQPEPETLAQYSGDFWSGELQTFYTIASDGEKLVMEHARHQDIDLVAVDKDVFTGRGRRPGQLTFERSGGEITGFSLSGGRVRNLLFRRV